MNAFVDARSEERKWWRKDSNARQLIVATIQLSREAASRRVM